MGSEISTEALLSFLKQQEALNRISAEVEYLDKLLEIARKRLSLRELEKYGNYLAKIRKRLENLNLERERILENLRASMPKYKRDAEIAERIIQLFYRLKENAEKDPTLLDEIATRLPDIRTKASATLKGLKESISVLERILRSGEIKEEKYIKLLEEEAEKIRNSLFLLERIVNALQITEESLSYLWSLLGYFVVQREPRSMLGAVTNIKLSRKSLRPLLEVSVEEPIPEDLLIELFKEVGADFKARNPEEFLDALHDRARDLLGVETDLTPSLLEKIFELEDVVLPSEIAKRIERKFSPKYYVYGDAIDEKKLQKKYLLLIDKGDFTFVEEEDADQLPSLTPLPKEFLHKEIPFGKFTYVIWNQALLPQLGYSAILLRRDETRNPVPDPRLARKILALLEKSGRSPIKLGREKKLERMSEERLLWVLRVAVVRGIGSKYDVTEGDALIPKNLFQFCLEFRIPITFEELLLGYFYATPTTNIVRKNVTIDFRAKMPPISLKRVLSDKNLATLLGNGNFAEIIGFAIPKKGSLIVKAIPKFDERKVLNAIKERYGVPPEAVKKASKGKIKRIIELLIYMGKVQTLDEYKALLDLLGVKSFPYDELIKKYNEPRRFLLLQLLKYL